MIHQAGVTVVATRDLFGMAKGSALAISGLAAAAAPPKYRRSFLSYLGGGLGIFGVVLCMGAVFVVGLTLLVLGVVLVVHTKRQDNVEHAAACRVWESTWCCKACGTRWRGSLVYRHCTKPM